jgi:DNA-binding GntR family transcriptional regulator
VRSNNKKIKKEGLDIPLGELAKRRIISGIQSGEFLPNHRIPEREICEALDISRTPVREAIRQLQTEGILVVKPLLGVVVVKLSVQQITEVYAIRNILEGFACNQAARFASDSEVIIMENILELAEQKTDDISAFEHLGKKFHKTIYGAARNQYVLQVLETLEVTFSLLPGSTYQVEGRIQQAIADHRGLLEAIKIHDGEAAEQLAREHMDGALRARLKISIRELE